MDFVYSSTRTKINVFSPLKERDLILTARL